MLITALLISFISIADSQSTIQPVTAPPSYGYMMHPFPYAYGYNGGLPGALPGSPIGVPFTGGMPPPGIMPGMPPGGLWGMSDVGAEMLGMAAGFGMAAGRADASPDDSSHISTKDAKETAMVLHYAKEENHVTSSAYPTML
ncbi:unnamed protein product [Cylicocyclus nassatus]|uniref:Uncharacterized protein n=1 Tax=Cylicocyclus nassatus TaxID=53992 RepID=A0AA36H7N5_CYLNA|nr:unnamed protein product [Cylicocyclus nassatus]